MTALCSLSQKKMAGQRFERFARRTVGGVLGVEILSGIV